jgi:hypothetical protein
LRHAGDMKARSRRIPMEPVAEKLNQRKNSECAIWEGVLRS